VWHTQPRLANRRTATRGPLSRGSGWSILPAVFDVFLIWLESTALSIWLREDPSIFVFPMILAVHTIGLGLLAGLNAALDLRVLGLARQIPVVEFRRFLPIMWLGLWLNVISGILLLIAYPTKALTNPVFYLKLCLIALALAVLRELRRQVFGRTGSPRTVKRFAAASLACWAGTIIAGRLLAYTYTRLTASSAF
jgi:hypothetical protein